MIYLILSAVMLIVGKFIYDTFLTNNTEKNWDAYKKSNPHGSIVSEHSNAFNLNTNAKLRTDGYYLSVFNGTDYNGDIFKIFFIMFFTKNGFVAIDEFEDLENYMALNKNDFKQVLIDADLVLEADIASGIVKYQIKNGGISMQFYDPNEYSNLDLKNNSLLEPNVFNEWKGTILHNGLLLTFSESFYNEPLKDYTKESRIKDLKFEFTQIKS
jgi:hypothetical protein